MGKGGGEGMFISKGIMLETQNYGYWKARMKQVIRGIHEDAWTAVEAGWTEPRKETEKDSGVYVARPKSEWTEDEKKMSKYNSRALTTIFSAVEKDQFELIQHCETAKEAWDVLQKSFEGTTEVKRSRLDTLASKFENLRMGENETITEFSSKISSIANEAHILGKKYKDKKLVKKLLRCLPEKFGAYKAVMSMSKDTDNMKFCEAVGILKSHEMEEQVDEKQKGIALSATSEFQKIDELENMIGLLAKRFDRVVRKGEVAQKKGFFNKRGVESDRSSQKNSVQCDECKGYGHIKSDCPSIKIKETKCFECKGLGHTQKQCTRRGKNRSMIGIEEEDSEDEDSDEEEMNNFVAFIGITDYIEKPESETVIGEAVLSDSESEPDDEPDMKKEFQAMCETLRKVGKEKLSLEQKNAELLSEIIKLRSDLNKEVVEATEWSKEKLLLELQKFELQSEVEKLNKELSAAKEEAQNYRIQLKDQTDRINRLGGTKKLDEIWNKQFEKPHHSNNGIGYTSSKGGNHQTKFVTQGAYKEKRQNHQPKVHNQIQSYSHGKCYYCGKHGHYRARCKQYWRRVDQLWYQGKFYASTRKGCILVKKSDLYGTSGSSSINRRQYERCNMAYLTSAEIEGEP